VHWVGTLTDGATVFDSTRGEGLTYRDGGAGKTRPAVVRLGGGPTPGVCLGLQEALSGMRIGGRRTVTVPAALGFGNQPALAPYAIVPAGSAVQYEIELLRLSRVGPDALLQGVNQCGGGFVMERTEGCGNIEPAEFL
jgi:FKBP-type peptidyl-prolyl cis-trans isomerase